MATIRLKSPSDMTAFCYQGKEFKVTDGRYVEVPEEIAVNLYACGFVNADEADKAEQAEAAKADKAKK